MTDLKRAIKGMCWCTFGIGACLLFAALYGDIHVDRLTVFATGATLILVALLILYYSSQKI